jgi:protein gp37
MADGSKIEWTDATWNPVRGCTRKSPGCINCYAEVMAARFSKPGQWGCGYATMKGANRERG